VAYVSLLDDVSWNVVAAVRINENELIDSRTFE
jgi:hypothetical protein